MSKHTPGPWVATQCDDYWDIWAPARGEGTRSLVSQVLDDIDDPSLLAMEPKANAALIAAAPELLALAHAAVRYLDTRGDDEHLRVALLAAIAKAEGGEP